MPESVSGQVVGSGRRGTDGFWHKRPTLVTGAAGFVGLWLVDRLCGLGAKVTCLVRDRCGEGRLRAFGVRPERVEYGDVRQQARLEEVMGEREIVTVFHLAAQSSVEVANRNPVSTFDTNLRGTWSVLEACRRSPVVSEVVVAGSDKAYGETETACDEEAPLRPVHPYDVSKASVDLMARAYAKTFGMAVGITRCANIFGGGDYRWSRLVPSTIRAALRGTRPVVRSDGRSVRDYLYVEDAVGAYTLLAEQLARRRELSGMAFNFGGGAPTTVVALATKILELMEVPPELEIRNIATSEIQRQVLDINRAVTTLGWRPEVSRDQGLRHTIAWYRSMMDEKVARKDDGVDAKSRIVEERLPR